MSRVRRSAVSCAAPERRVWCKREPRRTYECCDPGQEVHESRRAGKGMLLDGEQTLSLLHHHDLRSTNTS